MLNLNLNLTFSKWKGGGGGTVKVRGPERINPFDIGSYSVCKIVSAFQHSGTRDSFGQVKLNNITHFFSSHPYADVFPRKTGSPREGARHQEKHQKKNPAALPDESKLISKCITVRSQLKEYLRD